MNKADIKEMREWLKDCIWGDMEESDFDEISDTKIIQGIKQHYEGGVEQFLVAVSRNS